VEKFFFESQWKINLAISADGDHLRSP